VVACGFSERDSLLFINTCLFKHTVYRGLRVYVQSRSTRSTSVIITFPLSQHANHHHFHFVCPIIQQYAHLHEYDSRRAGQQGPIRTQTAALKHSIKTVTGCIFYHTNKNITKEKN